MANQDAIKMQSRCNHMQSGARFEMANQDAIRCNQMQSGARFEMANQDAIRCNQMQSGARFERYSEVLSGTQRSSEVLRGTQRYSEVLARNASTAPSGERRRRADEAASEFVRFMLDLMG